MAMATLFHPPFLQCRRLPTSLPAASISFPKSVSFSDRNQLSSFSCRAGGDDDYYIDAPESIGDGFSFGGGKYSEGPSKSDDWFQLGKMVKAHAVYGSGEKAKDPFFGLAMGAGSQASADVFKWFCVESGSPSKPTVILIHGFPSQAYSYRKILPTLAKSYHVIAFDWLGFGFSDKPQPNYGFNYTLDGILLSHCGQVCKQA